MQARTIEMMNRVYDLLIGEKYLSAEKLAEKCKLSVGSIYRMIRIMRQSKIGIIPTHKGYVLAEDAKKSDDVHLLRKINGRHAGDFITLQAALPHMKKRWFSITDKRNLLAITDPLHVDYGALEKGMEILKTTEEALRID